LESAGAALGLSGYDPHLHTIDATKDKDDVKAAKREAAAHGRREFYEMCQELNR